MSASVVRPLCQPEFVSAACQQISPAKSADDRHGDRAGAITTPDSVTAPTASGNDHSWNTPRTAVC
jgi:hypothetical protein